VLTSLEHKIRILSEFGLDYVLVIKFDEKFAAISAGSFIKETLLSRLTNLRKFIIGPRAHFGRGAEGDAFFLQKLAGKYGFKVEVTEEMVIDDAVVSSSVIRKFVRSGELDAAEACLGRKYSIYGTVIKGQRIGRRLGFPTANLDPQNEVYPPSGVYAVQVRLNEETYLGVLNIGFRPTVSKRDDLAPAIEVHILGFAGKLYGCKIEAIFHKRLRDEEHFATKEALMAQIRGDVEETQKSCLQQVGSCYTANRINRVILKYSRENWAAGLFRNMQNTPGKHG